jgi:hypothetical protein
VAAARLPGVPTVTRSDTTRWGMNMLDAVHCRRRLKTMEALQ